MPINTLAVRSDTAVADEAQEGAARVRRAWWLAVALTLFALSAVLFASGLAVVMSLS